MQDVGGRPPPLARTIFRGALALGSLRFAIRLLGFLSVTITARLLTPADFGVIGTAAIVTGFFAVLQQTGMGEALIRLRTITADDLHTAWTISLAVAALVTAAVLAAAGPAAAWLGEPKLPPVLHLLAFAPLINALGSPATATLLRNLQFQREFQLRIAQKLGTVVCVIAGAFLLRTYWGLVYGTLAGAIWGAVVSHVLVPHPVRLRLSGAAYFLSFSFWTLVQALGAYAGRTADEIAVRRVADTMTFGLYHVSRDLTRIFVAESVAPAAAALLPGLARLQGDPARFARAAMHAVGAGAVVAVPVGFGISAVAPEAIVLLLGGQWAAAAPFLSIVAIGSVAGTLVGMHRAILVALGRANVSAWLSLLRAAVLVIACQLAAWQWGAHGAAVAYAVVSVTLFVVDYEVVFRLLGRPGAIFGIVARPVLAGLLMMLALWAVPLPASLPLIARAAAKVALGVATYGLALSALWWAAGRPEGPETTMLEQAPRGLGRRLLPARR